MKASEILDTSAHLIANGRNDSHGPKLRNHENIALLWTAYMEVKFTPQDVALMMALLKIARTKAGEHNDDDYIDLAGYAGVAGEIAGTNEYPKHDPSKWVEGHGYVG